MATPQEIYDETKTRLDLNLAKLKQLEKLSDVVQPVESK